MVKALDLWLKRSRVQILTVRLSGQVVHTHVPLSPSSIIWYRPSRLDALAGEVTVGLVSHWPCVTDFSGLSSCNLREMRLGFVTLFTSSLPCDMAQTVWKPQSCSNRFCTFTFGTRRPQMAWGVFCLICVRLISIYWWMFTFCYVTLSFLYRIKWLAGTNACQMTNLCVTLNGCKESRAHLLLFSVAF